MTRILVLYCAAYGQMKAIADAIAIGAQNAGSAVDVRRLPDYLCNEPSELNLTRHEKQDDIVTVDQLAQYDAIILTINAQYGQISLPMTEFLNHASGIFADGRLSGKVGAIIAADALPAGHRESTLSPLIHTFMHFGMILVGLDYGAQGQRRMIDVVGTPPFDTLSSFHCNNNKLPHQSLLDGARYQGHGVAEVANKIFG